MSRLSRLSTYSLLVALFFLGSAFASAQSLSRDLQGLLSGSSGNVRVIIQFRQAPTLIDQLVLQGLGGRITNVFTLVPAIAAELPLGSLASLLKLTQVAYVTPDRALGALADVTAETAGAPVAWSYGLDGKGVGIAILDSGIAAHADLTVAAGTNSRVVYRENFVDSKSGDTLGHGTHVAGIAAGNGKASRGRFKGIAPGAHLLDLRVLDAQGGSRTAS